MPVEEARQGRFLLVENLSANFVTLLHPSLEDARHRTIGPRRKVLLDPAFQDSPDNQALVDLGFIAWERADSLIDDGRVAALGTEHAMDHPALEYLVQQILLFPEENLDMRESRAVRKDGSLPDIPMLAQVVWEIIFAAPLTPERVLHVDYLKATHAPMLENALHREKMWRNRPAIVEMLKRRIGEIRAMDTFGNIPQETN